MRDLCVPHTPGVHQKSPIPCLKSPQFPQKSPLLPQKSPRFPQKSSITAERVAFVSLILQFSHVWSQTFTNLRTVLDSIERKRVLYSVKRAPYWTCLLVDLSDFAGLLFVDSKGALFDIGPCQKSPMLRQKSPMLRQKSPTLDEHVSLVSLIL